MQISLSSLHNLPIFHHLKFIYDTLQEHGDIKIVGGCLRDIILNHQIKDVDLATTLRPAEVISILTQSGISVIPTGIAFGTVTAVMHGSQFEITTLRKDVSCDGRRAVVEFTNNWLEDSQRRDFTINALYSDLEGNLLDFHDGVHDIDQRIIRFIGGPAQRIQEDFLRILRYFRFHSYIGVRSIDSNSLENTIALASGLDMISGERIKYEMFKLLGGRFATEATQMLLKAGITEYIAMPNIQPHLAIQLLDGEPIVNLAAILKLNHCDASYLKQLAFRWRLSNQEKALLLHLCSHDAFDIKSELALKRAHYQTTPQLFEKCLLLQSIIYGYGINIVRDILTKSATWQYPTFPVSSEKLMQLGYSGKALGDALKSSQDQWVSSDFTCSEDDLIKRLQCTS